MDLLETDLCHYMTKSEAEFEKAVTENINRIQNEQTQFKIAREYLGREITPQIEQIVFKRLHKILKIQRTSKRNLLKKLNYINDLFFSNTIISFIKEYKRDEKLIVAENVQFKLELNFYNSVLPYFNDKDKIVEIKNNLDKLVHSESNATMLELIPEVGETYPVYFMDSKNLELFKDVITWPKNRLTKKINDITASISMNELKLTLTVPDEASIEKNLDSFLDTIKTTSNPREIGAVIDFHHIFITTLESFTRTIDSNLETFKNISKLINNVELNKTTVNFFSKFLQNYIEEGDLKKPINSVPWIVEIIKRIMLVQLLNDTNTLVQGSFVTFLINKNVKYSDIDLYHSDSFRFMLNLALMIQVISGYKLHIVKVPFIKNYVVMKDDFNCNILDCCHFDEALINSTPKLMYKHYNVLHPVCILINMFRMLSVKERRVKLSKDVDKAVVSYSTLFDFATKDLKIKFNKYKGFEIKKFMQMIKINDPKNLIINFEDILPGFKLVHFKIASFEEVYKFIADSKNTNGFFSRSFGSVLDEIFYEYNEKKTQNVICSFRSLETQITTNDEISFETIKSMLWSFTLFLYLKNRIEEANDMFSFCFEISKKFKENETISELVPRIKNAGFHKEINFNRKMYIPIYYENSANKLSIPFSEFVLQNF
ncbi:poly(A)-polymerase catalytic subunit PAPL [Carp edema virus]|nr:poly(A)-polymerase catalytic subunit PAPL [Carp edema virus]